MIKMEEVGSDFSDSSPLNAKWIERDCSVGGLCPSIVYLEKSKEPVRVFFTVVSTLLTHL